LDVLQKIIDSPMVLCDLSSRNPNVLFELGLRQAFDKPVALVQETGTPQIFDIAPLRFANYRRALIYHEVLRDQDTITAAITATRDASADSNSVNSIVKLLGLTHPASKASITESDRDSAMLRVIMTELSNLRSEIRSVGQPSNIRHGLASLRRIGQIVQIDELSTLQGEYDRLTDDVQACINNSIPPTDFSDEFHRLHTRLTVWLAGDAPDREKAVAVSLRNRLLDLQVRHDNYVRSTKAELEG
jgi:hypothetical protein